MHKESIPSGSYTSYSRGNIRVLGRKRGERLGLLIERLLKKRFKAEDVKGLKLLDVGCSSGTISSYLANRFGFVVGIDIDKPALLKASKIKKPNLKFYFMDASRMIFEHESFDIVILNQVHYFFKNQQKLFDEVYRVLKPDGICFLSGTNKYRIIKPFEPVPTYYKSFWELKKLLSKFEIKYQTKEIASSRSKILELVPGSVWNIFEPLSPNFVWILDKKRV